MPYLRAHTTALRTSVEGQVRVISRLETPVSVSRGENTRARTFPRDLLEKGLVVPRCDGPVRHGQAYPVEPGGGDCDQVALSLRAGSNKEDGQRLWLAAPTKSQGRLDAR